MLSESVKNKIQPPLDVYDADVEVLSPLSERSVKAAVSHGFLISPEKVDRKKPVSVGNF
jgi:hypothetical protein